MLIVIGKVSVDVLCTSIVCITSDKKRDVSRDVNDEKGY